MTDKLIRFKTITIDDMFKGVDKSYSSNHTLNSTDLKWFYVDRNSVTGSDLSDDMKNLFHSFGIAREDEEDWFKVFNVHDWYNAKRMVICTIPQSGLTSYIDGSTVKLNVPWNNGSDEYTTFYGSVFEGYPDPITNNQVSSDYSDSIYGGAYCYLFGDTASGAYGQPLPVGTFAAGVDHPYTGNVNGNINPNAGESSFDSDGSATIPHLSATHWSSGDDGNDIPYGIAFLDRGIFVIFDMYGREDFIGNTELSGSSVWTADIGTTFGAVTTSGGTQEKNTNDNIRQDISFTGTDAITSASLNYRTIDQSYKMIYFCHAGQNEFNSTSNHTYNQKKGFYQPEEADSLWITEIGLYDDNDDILAYAKLSEPVEKNKLETLTFKVELEL